MFRLYIFKDSKNTIPEIEIIPSIAITAVMTEVMRHTRRKLHLIFLLMLSVAKDG